MLKPLSARTCDHVAGGNRTVELTGFAGRTHDHEGLAVELLGDLLGFRLALEVAGFEHRTLGFETGLVGGIGAQRLALGQQEVAGVAVANLYGFAHLAELGDAFKKDDVHCSVLSGSCQVLELGPEPVAVRVRAVSNSPRNRKNANGTVKRTVER
jgi:hypothetical protein